MAFLKNELVILRASFGATFDKTEITPFPPNESIGKIWSSLPEYIAKSSPQRCAILAICEILILASLIQTILSILESSKHVSGRIFIPVLLGTLYKMIGIETEVAIALKCSITPF